MLCTISELICITDGLWELYIFVSGEFISSPKITVYIFIINQRKLQIRKEQSMQIPLKSSILMKDETMSLPFGQL